MECADEDLKIVNTFSEKINEITIDEFFIILKAV